MINFIIFQRRRHQPVKQNTCSNCCSSPSLPCLEGQTMPVEYSFFLSGWKKPFQAQTLDCQQESQLPPQVLTILLFSLSTNNRRNSAGTSLLEHLKEINELLHCPRQAVFFIRTKTCKLFAEVLPTSFRKHQSRFLANVSKWPIEIIPYSSAEKSFIFLASAVFLRCVCQLCFFSHFMFAVTGENMKLTMNSVNSSASSFSSTTLLSSCCSFSLSFSFSVKKKQKQKPPPHTHRSARGLLIYFYLRCSLS